MEEDFAKNRIRCSLAAGNASATLGFVVVGKAKPMTLLKGNELNTAKAKKLDLVLRRKSGEVNFRRCGKVTPPISFINWRTVICPLFCKYRKCIM